MSDTFSLQTRLNHAFVKLGSHRAAVKATEAEIVTLGDQLAASKLVISLDQRTSGRRVSPPRPVICR